MNDRGIKKWAPYKSLKEQDFSLRSHKDKQEKIEKPLISSEFAEEINEILVNYEGELLEIKYYRNGKINVITDRIKLIDQYEKKLVLFSRRSIMLKEITSISKDVVEDY